MARLAGRVAVITGAARGIGAATAQLFAAEGAALVLNDRDAEPLEATADAIRLGGAAVEVVVGDCADPVVSERIARTAVESHGTIDVVVNNAGGLADGVVHALEAADWRQVHHDIVEGTIATTTACLVEMRGRAQDELAADGHVAHQRKVITTSAASALTGSPGQATLTTAAAAILGLTRTLARELGGFGINVNAVVPGFIETRLTAPLDADAVVGVAEPVRQMTKAMTALGRYGTPDDVARVHLFLASADADFVTGASIPVTGGLLGTCT